MTIITNKRTVILVVLVLAVILLYIGIRQEAKPSAEEETAALLRQLGNEQTDLAASEPAAAENPSGTVSLPEVSSLEGEFFQETVKQNLPVKSGQDFFVNYRLERDRIRSREVEMLQQIVNNPNSGAENRDEAQNMIVDITGKMDQEMQLEHLIVAKGFADAAAFVNKEAVTVIVLSPSLADQDVTRIADLAARVTGQKMENIVIIPKA